MTSFKIRMTGQQSDYFCLRVQIETAMTYFRRTNSQEKSKEKKAKREPASQRRQRGKPWRGKDERG
jgi:hypothetical protein